MSEPRRVAVVGPTGSGKSAVALAVAEEAGATELISIDSMQVYRGMDIGTAKPTPAERSRVPHHLLDLVDPDHDFTVAEFQREYRRTLDELARRGAAAILVGGTGLYSRAAIDDLELPGEWPEVRRRLETEADEGGSPAMYARLVAVDPVAASRIEPSNTRRLVRALEVCEGSGRRFSSFGPGLDVYPNTPVTQIGLRWDRELLARRIERRVDQMMENGLLEEVRDLYARDLSRTARQALGYKELFTYLDGGASLADSVALIVVRTRQFAVRQLRWFGRDPRVRWIDVEHDPVAEAAPIVLATLTS